MNPNVQLELYKLYIYQLCDFSLTGAAPRKTCGICLGPRRVSHGVAVERSLKNGQSAMVVVSPISWGYGAPMATMVKYVIWTCTSKWKRQRPLKCYVTTLQSLVMFYLFWGSSKSNKWGLTGLLPTCQTYTIVQLLGGHLQSMTFLGRVQ